MTRLLLAVLVLAVWVALTTVAAWATPPRHQPDALPDLAYDPHWLLRTPPNPVQYDKVTRRVTATTTTTTRFGGGGRKVDGTAARANVSARASTPANTTPGGVEQWRDEVAVYSGWNVDLMLAIMGCESKGDPNAKNRYSSASGLFQILDGPYDPVANIALAHSMWSTRGTQPWNSSRGCWG